MTETSSEYHLNLANDGIASLRLVLEPWAEEWIIEPGHEAQLIGQGAMKDARFELRLKPSVVVAYAWRNSTVRVIIDGKIMPSASQAIPAI